MTPRTVAASHHALERYARATLRAKHGAAVRDQDARTYAASTVELPSLMIDALDLAVARAVSSGAKGLEAAALVGDGQPEHRGPVDDRREQSVTIHVDEALVGLRRPKTVVEQPGATERSVRTARGHAADAHHAAVDHPTGLAVGGDDARRALVIGFGQP